MNNPAIMFPEAMQALLALNSASEKGGVPSATIGLVQLRASQINGCSVCVDMHARYLKKLGETDQRLFAVAAWRDAPYFSDAERAALACRSDLFHSFRYCKQLALGTGRIRVYSSSQQACKPIQIAVDALPMIR